MVGIEPEIIQGAPANRICVLILRKRFTVPRDRPTCLSDSPGLTAVTLVVKRAIVCPTGFLKRSVKGRITDVNSRRHRYAERLNTAIEVLVIERVLIMPDALAWISYFVTHEPDAVIPRIRLNLVYCGSRPR